MKPRLMIGCHYLNDTKFEQSASVNRKYLIFSGLKDNFLSMFFIFVLRNSTHICQVLVAWVYFFSFFIAWVCFFIPLLSVYIHLVFLCHGIFLNFLLHEHIYFVFTSENIFSIFVCECVSLYLCCLLIIINFFMSINFSFFSNS